MSSHYQMPVLLYHRVVPKGSVIGKHKLHVWEDQFCKQMQWLKDNDYQTITFRDLASVQNTGPAKKQIILTFDDGYDDNYNILFPVLKEYKFKAVIFLVTACRQNDWSIVQGEPAINLMTADQIKEMDAYGIEFGGHTQKHVDLKNAGIALQEQEITGCYHDLEQLLGKKPVSFSYPYGAYNNDTLALVKKAGFNYAVTTIFGPDDFNGDPLLIRRLEIRPHSGLYNFKRKASGRYLRTNFFNFPFTQ
jgi:peptidoglycan/xylan/chitin deacetylase (PgdA/CDA1 family)